MARSCENDAFCNQQIIDKRCAIKAADCHMSLMHGSRYSYVKDAKKLSCSKRVFSLPCACSAGGVKHLLSSHG